MIKNKLPVGYKLMMLLIIAVLGMVLMLPSVAFAGVDQWTSNGPYGGYIYSLAISPNYSTDNAVFAGTVSSGVYKSTNGGASWTQAGLASANVNSLAISPNFATDSTLFAGPGWWEMIYKSTNGGASWTLSNSGLPNASVSSLAISPNYSTDNTVFAGTASSGVYKSTNGGASWTQAGLASANVNSLAISPNFATDSTLFAGTWGGGVCKSTNGGTSWTQAGLASAYVRSFAISPNFATDNTIFAGTVSSGVYKSTNGGASWSQIGLTNHDVRSLVISPNYSTDSTLFAGTESGVYGSTNGGASWSQFNSGLTNTDIQSLAISPNFATDSTLFTGTNGGGVCSYTLSAITPPSTTLSTNPLSPDGTNGWFKTVPTITLSSNKPGTTYYQWDSTTTAWTTYSGNFTAPQGQHTLYYYSVDNYGNGEMIQSQILKVDLTNPTAIITSPANGASVSGSVPIIGTASDTNFSNYVLDYGAGSTPSSWTTITSSTTQVTGGTLGTLNTSSLADGLYTVRLTANDAAGRTSTVRLQVNIKNDITPPITTITTNPSSPDGLNGWFKTTPTITLTSNEPGTTYYQWDSTSTAGWLTYSSLTAPEGIHTLYYYSVDNSGNAEQTKSQTFKVDTQAPLAPTISSPANGATLNTLSVTITGAAEANSTLYIYEGANEVASTQVRSDGSYSLAATLSAGSHTLDARCQDEAGNLSPASNSITITIESQSTRTTDTLISDGGSGRVIEVTPSGTIAWSMDGLSFPVVANRLANGNTLISEWYANRVIEVNPQKQIVWQYSTGLSRPAGVRLANSNTLITDCGNDRVIEVDTNGNIVWQYGQTGVAGTGAGQLNQPYYSVRLSDGSTLIGDAFNHRVIRVRTTDYPYWTASSILWQYGTTGVAGSGYNQLNFSPCAFQLTNGNYLICDNGNQRYIEATPDKQIVWQYGTTGVAGSGANQLNGPRGGERLANGDTIIADWGNNRVIEVTQAGQIDWQYGTTGVAGSGAGQLSGPISAFEVASGLEGDSIPPTTPANLKAYAVTDTRIDLTWDASTDDKAVTGYSIYNAATDGKIADVTGTSFSHTGLTPDTPYTYYVRAYDAAGNLSGKSNIASARTPVSIGTGSVQTGTGITVPLSGGATITFDSVSASGDVSVVYQAGSLSPPPNFSFVTGSYYDVSTTAQYSGYITVTLPYNPTDVVGGASSLKLFHYANNSWQDVTVSVDTVNHTITGKVTSLSPIAVVQSSSSGSSSVPASSNWSLGLMALAALAILRRKLKARKAQEFRKAVI